MLHELLPVINRRGSSQKDSHLLDDQVSKGTVSPFHMGTEVMLSPIKVGAATLRYIEASTNGLREVYKGVFFPQPMTVSEVYPLEEYKKLVSKIDDHADKVSYVRQITTATSREQDSTPPVTSQFFVSYYPHGLPEKRVKEVADYYSKFDETDSRNRFGCTKLGEPEMTAQSIMGRDESSVLIARDLTSREIVGTAVIITDKTGTSGEFAFDCSASVRKAGLGDALRRDSLGFAHTRGVENLFFEIYTENQPSLRSVHRVSTQPEVPWEVHMGRPEYGTIEGVLKRDSNAS